MILRVYNHTIAVYSDVQVGVVLTFKVFFFHFRQVEVVEFAKFQIYRIVRVRRPFAFVKVCDLNCKVDNILISKFFSISDGGSRYYAICSYT